MNDKNIKKTPNLIIAGIMILSISILAGVRINELKIGNVQGYMYSAIGEATDGEATDGNATDGEYEESTAADACWDENVYMVNNGSGFYPNQNSITVNPGEPVNVLLNLDTNTGYGYTEEPYFTLTNVSTGMTYSLPVEWDGTDYIVLPTNMMAGTYKVSRISAVLCYCYTDTPYYFTDDNDARLVVGSTTTPSAPASTSDTNTKAPEVINPIKLTSIALDTTDVKPNDKVNLKLNVDQKLSSLKLVFKGDNNNITVYGKSLNDAPYIEVPSTVVNGKYTLITAVLSNSKVTTVYSSDKSVEGATSFKFNSVLNVTVAEENSKEFVLNNEELTDEVLQKIYNADNDAKISVTADSNPIIAANLFSSIKGTNKELTINYNENQLIFDGTNIETPKSIDTTITAESVKTSTDIKDLVSDGIVLNFANNGFLPGKAKVRIKVTNDMATELNNEKVYVYLFDKEVSKFKLIAKDVTFKDGYYEFELNHNSKYVLVKNALNKSLIETDEKVEFTNGNKTNYVLIVAGAIVLIAGVVGVVVLTKKKKVEE